MLGPLDHVLAVVLAVAFPLRAALFGLRRLRRASEEQRPRLRRHLYREAMAIQWSLALAVLAVWWTRGRGWDGLGLVLHPGRGLLLTAIVVGCALAVLYAQLFAVRRRDEGLARVAERVRHIEVMLPHDARELRLFRWLALTAGLCEELLYRGYLLWYAAHFMPAPWALAATSVAFGLGHLYQGWRGVVATAAVGALLAVVYVTSGSLHLAMAAHALVDLHAGQMTYAALARAAARAAERARAATAAEERPA